MIDTGWVGEGKLNERSNGREFIVDVIRAVARHQLGQIVGCIPRDGCHRIIVSTFQ